MINTDTVKQFLQNDNFPSDDSIKKIAIEFSGSGCDSEQKTIEKELKEQKQIECAQKDQVEYVLYVSATAEEQDKTEKKELDGFEAVLREHPFVLFKKCQGEKKEETSTEAEKTASSEEKQQAAAPMEDDEESKKRKREQVEKAADPATQPQEGNAVKKQKTEEGEKTTKTAADDAVKSTEAKTPEGTAAAAGEENKASH